ncbi:hypothetical protein [Mesorhizobium sp. B2-4-5]|uniref:hypothetical protein n=1 Tax=Mesorhizobium sp. B2-4-5 TaxID=2589944 RepID=UPI001126AC92|nr:hypothetical protein [Mesorhizobium sp. B2-4-5]TPL42604.1 hypothetical protein FJ961_07900 [Mesorhizobium sp. B2-4-5]
MTPHEKILASKKAYRERNREKEAAYKKDYRERNREKEAAYKKIYYEANKDKIAAERTAKKASRPKIERIPKEKVPVDPAKRRAEGRARYYKNKERAVERSKEYYVNNRSTILERVAARARMRSIKQRFFDGIKEQIRQQDRRRSNPNAKIAHRLRVRLRRVLGGQYKNGSAVSDLGCSIPEFKTYIEAKFLPGMSWENWAFDTWHLDHIKPLASFDLTDRAQFLQACHYTNMQPLWALDNMKKGAR